MIMMSMISMLIYYYDDNYDDDDYDYDGYDYDNSRENGEINGEMRKCLR